MAENYLLVMKCMDRRGAVTRVLPIGTHLRSLSDARQAMRWQETGGNSDCLIATATKLPGILEEHGKPGVPLLLERGGLTDAAFGGLLVDLWGDAVEGWA